MARQTRAQRKARREAQQADGSGAVVQRAPVRRRDGVPAAPVRAPHVERRLPGGGLRTFVAESWAELQKVEWPGQRQVIQGTVVVLIACVIVGAYLWGADLLLKRLVENVLLR